MKAKPVKYKAYSDEDGGGGNWVECHIDEATHVQINIPGPSGKHVFPFILRGTRAGTNFWTWNGDTEKPTLHPSVLIQGHNYRCHTWINDGQARYLEDSSHEFVNTTQDLLDI